jgi:glutaredoxin 3
MSSSAASVVIYTTSTCGFCHAAKSLLGKKGISYREVAVDRRPDLRSWLRDVTGRHTVPQIFINARPIGGYTDLARLAATSQLDERLAQAPAVDNPALRS